ncbi:hypothetical protein TWF191_002722 [Orbilia oligospora]|uniref:Uncharacterized protein n=1 Tax=Orbilia oligospora TaxID=2813651 RepID=A0A7C8V1V6_ORBOL|nr:hypothetical protein TWF679_005507 [Orbilia oligospora]KAF3228218.1 hypothetical protein TWF191_002722 [Orbilia oligospora]
MGRGSRKAPKKKSKASRRGSRSGSASSSSSGGRTPGRGGRANIVLKKQTSRSTSSEVGEYGTSIPLETGLRTSRRQDNITPQSESSTNEAGWGGGVNTVTQNFGEDLQANGYGYGGMDVDSDAEYEADHSGAGDSWSLNQLVRDGVHAIRDFVEGGMREARQYLPSPEDSQDLEIYEIEEGVEESRSVSEKQSIARNGREEPTRPGIKESKQKVALQPYKGGVVTTKQSTGLRMAGSRSSKEKKEGAKKEGEGKKSDGTNAAPPSGRRPTHPSVRGRGRGSIRGGRGAFRPGGNIGGSGKAVGPPTTPGKPKDGTDKADGKKPNIPPQNKPKVPVGKPGGPPKKSGAKKPSGKKSGNPPRLQSPGRDVMRPDSPEAKGRPTQMHAAKPPRSWQRGVLMFGDILPRGMSLNQLRSPPGLNAVPVPPSPPGTPAINLIPPSDESSATHSFITTNSLTPPEQNDWLNPRARRPLGGPQMVQPNFGKGGGPPDDPDTQLEPIFECPGCSDSGAMVVAVILILVFTVAWVMGNKRKDKRMAEAKQSRLSKIMQSQTAQKVLSRIPSVVTDKAAVVGNKLGSFGGVLKTVDEAMPISERVGFADPVTMGREERGRVATSVNHRAEVLKQLGLPRTATWEDINLHINGNKTTEDQIRKASDTQKFKCSGRTCDPYEDLRTTTTLSPLSREPMTIKDERTSSVRSRVPSRDGQAVKPENWDRNAWRLYTRISSDIFWCPATDIKKCLPPGHDNDVAISDAIARVEHTLEYFGTIVKKQKDSLDAEGSRRTTIAPGNRPVAPSTTSTPLSLVGTVTALPTSFPIFGRVLDWVGWLLSWFKGILDYIVTFSKGIWTFLNYVFQGSAQWRDFVVRLELASGFIKRRYLGYLFPHGTPPEAGILNALATLALSKFIEILQYWFPPLTYYIDDSFINTPFPGKAVTIIRAIIWYQLGTAQLMIVLMWPAVILLGVLHPFLICLSPIYRRYYRDHSRLSRRVRGTDVKMLSAIWQFTNHMIGWIDLVSIVWFGGFFWLGTDLFPGQWVLKWVVVHLWGFLKAACRWWISVPTLIFDLMTTVASGEISIAGFRKGLGRIWQEFFMPPIKFVVWVIFMAKVTVIGTIFILYKTPGYLWRSLRDTITRYRRRSRTSGSGPPKPPTTPRGKRGYPGLTPGGGGILTPSGTRHPVPFTIDRKLQQSERKVSKSLQVKFKQEERLRALRVMAAEARYNIGLLNNELLNPSTQAARAHEARDEKDNLETLLDEIKMHMALTITRVNKVIATFERSRAEYDRDQKSFSNGINRDQYISAAFRGDSAFRDLAPSEATAAIENTILDMGIQIHGQRRLRSVSPSVPRPTVNQGTDATTVPPTTVPRPDEIRTRPVVTRNEGGTTQTATTTTPSVIDRPIDRITERTVPQVSPAPPPPRVPPVDVMGRAQALLVAEVRPEPVGETRPIPVRETLLTTIENGLPPVQNIPAPPQGASGTTPGPVNRNAAITRTDNVLAPLQNPPVVPPAAGNATPRPPNNNTAGNTASTIPPPIQNISAVPQVTTSAPGLADSNVAQTRTAAPPVPQDNSSTAPGPSGNNSAGTTNDTILPPVQNTPVVPPGSGNNAPGRVNNNASTTGTETVAAPAQNNTIAPNSTVSNITTSTGTGILLASNARPQGPIPETRPATTDGPTKPEELRPKPGRTIVSERIRNIAERASTPTGREQRRTENTSNPTPVPPVTRKKPLKDDIIPPSPITNPSVESRPATEPVNTNLPTIPENTSDDDSLYTLPPASAIPAPIDFGQEAFGASVATSPPTRPPGGQNTALGHSGTQVPETITGGQRPPASVVQPSPFETGQSGFSSTSTAPVQPPVASGSKPPPFSTYNKPQDPPKPSTQGSQIPRPPKKEESKRRKQPTKSPMTKNEVPRQSHTSVEAGAALPPVDRSPRHSTERPFDFPPIDTAVTSPGTGRLSYPDFGFRRPPGSLSPSSNIDRVGITHVPSVTSPSGISGSPGTRQRVAFGDRFSPGLFGWNTKQSGSPTTGGSSQTTQQYFSQQPDTQPPSTSQTLGQNSPVIGPSDPPNPSTSNKSQISPKNSRIPLPLTTKPSKSEPLKASSSMASTSVLSPSTPEKKTQRTGTEARAYPNIPPPTLGDLLPSEENTPMRRNMFIDQETAAYYERKIKEQQDKEAEEAEEKRKAEAAPPARRPGEIDLLQQFQRGREDRLRSQEERRASQQGSQQTGSGNGSKM